MPAVTYDFAADRWVDFVKTIAFVDQDYSAASAIKMEVRRYPDEAGTALITLSKVTTEVQGVRIFYSGTDTIQNHILAGRLDGVPDGYELTDSVFITQLKIRIDDANVKTLPFPEVLGTGQRGDNVVLAYSMNLTLSGDLVDLIGGQFIVIAGAAQ